MALTLILARHGSAAHTEEVKRHAGYSTDPELTETELWEARSLDWTSIAVLRSPTTYVSLKWNASL